MPVTVRWFARFGIAALLLAACAPVTSAPTEPVGLIIPTLPGQAAPTTAPTSAGPAATPLSLQWSEPPAMAIDPGRIYLATFKTARGDIVVELLADKAPVTVNNFVFLAREGFYDNTTFHRVLADFMAQGGDPTATGSGGPGYRFGDEFHPDLRFDEPGMLAMANSGPNTNGSQFFITFVPTPHLNGRHTIFGKVVAGLDVAQSLTLRDPDTGPTFPGDALLTVEIEEAAASLLPPPTATPLPNAPEPEAGRPLALLDIPGRENIYNAPPAMAIDAEEDYFAVITTSRGEVVVELHAADAPLSVNNFVVLAELGYWDGFPINYAEPGEFVLTGSPAGQPSSDIGYIVPSEAGRPHTNGSVGYWYRDDRLGSSGSQFYIVLKAADGMDARFTTFGTVVEGLEVAEKLSLADSIESIRIETR